MPFLSMYLCVKVAPRDTAHGKGQAAQAIELGPYTLTFFPASRVKLARVTPLTAI